MRRRSTNRAVALLALIMPVLQLSAGYWPQFRGPGGRGVSEETGLPTKWSEKENLGWKIPLPGPGSSSPIVCGNRVFVTCYSGYGSTGTTGGLSDLKRHLLCVDVDTGEVIWSKAVPSAATEDPWRGGLREHGYASSTPVCDGERVFVFFGKTGVLTFDLEGRELWRKGLGSGSSNRRWGSASSPILCGDVLIVNASEESRTIYALDRRTGETTWKVTSDKTELTYGTPALAALPDGRQELVVAVPHEVWGLDPSSGECTWWAFTDLAGNVSPSLVAVGDVVYAFGGYPRVGSAAIRAGGKEDVTDTHVLWTSRDSSYVPSPLEHEGYLYWVTEKGVSYCMKADTGQVVYTEKLEAGRGNSFYASVALADGKLYAPSRRNGTFVLSASPAFELLSLNTFASDQSDFNGSPAISNGRIFLRSNTFLYCICQTPR